MERYLSPENQPVALLDCKQAFSNLTPKEKLYSHYLSRASWEGSLICFEQTSPESPVIFQIFQALFHGNSIEELKAKSNSFGVSESDFHNFLQYIAAFYGNLGNYLSFGDTKFVPRIPKEKFRSILESSTSPSKAKILEKFDEFSEQIYSLEPGVLSLGLEDHGISTYYSSNIKEKDVEKIQPFMQKQKISPYNTRLWKISDTQFEIRFASSSSKPTETHNFEGLSISLVYGDHSPFLTKVVENLKEAVKYTANDTQTEMLNAYIHHFTGGDINDHKEAQRKWIKDIGPVVETNIGFIESYRDPKGERGEFEGFVAVVNKEVSAKFNELVTKAESFIPLLPWPKDFEKDKFLKPDFTSLEVVTFASSGVPAGINIPNYDDIRQTQGFKNVSLGNVLSAKSTDPPEFILPQEQEFYQKLDNHAFEVQVGIHELLGHGTGKLFQRNEKGEFNFPKDLKNPLTNEPIKTWYEPGETWDSKFHSWASTMEECRAECSGIYLCTNLELLKIFGYHDKEAEDIYYINWLIMCRAGVRALEFYSPQNQKWGQAHMQARFAILRVLLEAGEGLVQIKVENDDAFVVLDRSKILTVGKKAIGIFLQKLQIYKSTANSEEGIKFYSGYTQVTEEFLKLREIVLKKRKPRRVFVQVNTKLVDGEVLLEEYPPTAEGLVNSFVNRFPSNL